MRGYPDRCWVISMIPFANQLRSYSPLLFPHCGG